MSTSKIKNIVIAVLIFINLFFLAVLTISSAGEAAEHHRILDDLRMVFTENGIGLPESLPGSLLSMKTLETERDAFGEASAARAVLGDCSPSGEGGANSVYTGARGTAEFNARGELKIELTEPYTPRGGSAAAVAKRLLRDMGIDAAAPTIHENDEITTAVAVCEYKGVPMFNCSVSFEFNKAGALLRVTGRRPTGIKEAPQDRLRDLPTALLGFLTFTRAGGADCTELISVAAAYRLTVSAFGDGTLSPGWLITTDAGVYFIDALMGEIVTADAP